MMGSGQTITSNQNARLKNAAKLRDRRAREKQGRIVIDGVREINRAMRAGIAIEEFFYCGELCERSGCASLLAAAKKAGIECIDVARKAFEKIAFGERNEGVVAIAQTPHPLLDGLTLPANPLVVVLQGVEKPGNVGAVARTADGGGVSALIVADGRTDLFNPNAIRASLGAIFTLPVCTAGSEETLTWLNAIGVAVFTARVDAPELYAEADLTGPAAIVLGSEAAGLSDIWTGNQVTPIQLPMLGSADSLNVSSAAAILIYEAWRQRHGPF